MKIPGIQHLTSNSSNELSVMSPREAESPEESCLRDKNFTCIAAYGHGKSTLYFTKILPQNIGKSRTFLDFVR